MCLILLWQFKKIDVHVLPSEYEDIFTRNKGFCKNFDGILDELILFSSFFIKLYCFSSPIFIFL